MPIKFLVLGGSFGFGGGGGPILFLWALKFLSEFFPQNFWPCFSGISGPNSLPQIHTQNCRHYSLIPDFGTNLTNFLFHVNLLLTGKVKKIVFEF